MKAGIVAKQHAEGIEVYIKRTVEALKVNGVEIAVEEGINDIVKVSDEVFRRRELPFKVNFLIVLGGDGTLLSVADVAAEAGIPLIGVNLGFLGFLTEVKKDELEEALEEFLEGKSISDERELLEVRFRSKKSLVLNDAVINKSALARIITLRICIDGHEISRLRADGIIVSTPTGSTGYSLAAGGPVVNPSVSAILLTPICPHALTQRPIVVPSESKVSLKLLSGEEVYLTLDGQRGEEMMEREHVEIRKADVRLKLVRPSGRSYYQMLKEKLNWGS
ncbi:MAG: NAD(+)/NADH kinase [Candidatus Aminicenantes bacterium]|nr:NAD(+)/NADH kinase [Candidatus Aminicenantes bacterium]